MSANRRYERIVDEFGEIGRRAGTLGMHVHVGIADDEESGRVLDGWRPWSLVPPRPPSPAEPISPEEL